MRPPTRLAAIAARRDLPPPNCVIHTSPNRVHILWQVIGFTKEGVEALQKQLAGELGTDRAATSCAQVTRLPGFVNYKYRPGATVSVTYVQTECCRAAAQFPDTPTAPAVKAPISREPDRQRPSEVRERARRYIAAIPPAVEGSHGDTATFRVCCRLVRGFGLDDDAALALLVDWNRACDPPWSERDLRAKLHAARRYGREPVGGLLRSP